MNLPPDITFERLTERDERIVKKFWKSGLLSINPNAESADDYLSRKSRENSQRSRDAKAEEVTTC